MIIRLSHEKQRSSFFPKVSLSRTLQGNRTDKTGVKSLVYFDYDTNTIKERNFPSQIMHKIRNIGNKEKFIREINESIVKAVFVAYEKDLNDNIKMLEKYNIEKDQYPKLDIPQEVIQITNKKKLVTKGKLQKIIFSLNVHKSVENIKAEQKIFDSDATPPDPIRISPNIQPKYTRVMSYNKANDTIEPVSWAKTVSAKIKSKDAVKKSFENAISDAIDHHFEKNEDMLAKYKLHSTIKITPHEIPSGPLTPQLIEKTTSENNAAIIHLMQHTHKRIKLAALSKQPTDYL